MVGYDVIIVDKAYEQESVLQRNAATIEQALAKGLRVLVVHSKDFVHKRYQQPGVDFRLNPSMRMRREVIANLCSRKKQLPPVCQAANSAIVPNWQLGRCIPMVPAGELTIGFCDFNSEAYSRKLIESLELMGVDFRTTATLCLENKSNDKSFIEFCQSKSIQYYDNTKAQLTKTTNLGWAFSNNHSSSLEWLLTQAKTRYVLILDNDVQVTYPVQLVLSSFKQSDKAVAGSVSNGLNVGGKAYGSRINPYYCFIDLEKYKQLGLSIAATVAMPETFAAFSVKAASSLLCLDMQEFKRGPRASFYNCKFFVHYGSSSFVANGLKKEDNANSAAAEVSTDAFLKQVASSKEPWAVCAMTTHRARIGSCIRSIKSILNNWAGLKVALTLASDELALADIPAELQLLQKTGQLDIIWCPKNIKQYKKFIYVLESHKYKQLPVISVDDDINYDLVDFAMLKEACKANPDKSIAVYDATWYTDLHTVSNQIFTGSKPYTPSCGYCTVYPIKHRADFVQNFWQFFSSRPAYNEDHYNGFMLLLAGIDRCCPKTGYSHSLENKVYADVQGSSCRSLAEGTPSQELQSLFSCQAFLTKAQKALATAKPTVYLQ